MADTGRGSDFKSFAEVHILELTSSEDEDDASSTNGEESDELAGGEVVEVGGLTEEQELELLIARNAMILAKILQGSKVVLLYPFHLARTLMQIGYEPVQPIPSVTLFRRPCLILPNVFSYLKYIRSVDGLLGCYRGLVPYLLYRGSHYVTHQACSHMSQVYLAVTGIPNSPYCIEEQGAGDYTGPPAYEGRVHVKGEFRTYLRDMGLDVVWKGVAITVSYPFRVVAIHAMASFIGREPELTNGVFGIMKAIWNVQGVSGFFKGLTPCLLGEGVGAVIIGLCTYVIKVRLGGGFLRWMLRNSMEILTGTVSYPFRVVSNTMAINGGCSQVGSSGLFTPVFSSWTECWDYLNKHGQLRRGSNLIWRYYSGPTLIYGGLIRPSPLIYFGPNLSNSYKF